MSNTFKEWMEELESCVVERGMEVEETWRKINRRAPYMAPGYEWLKPFKLVVLVDASGFVSDEEYTGFVSELNSVAEENDCGIHLILFSNNVLGELIREQIDPKQVLSKIKHSQNEPIVIKNALKKALEVIEEGDIIVIFTSGNLSDEDDQETIEYADILYQKSYRPIFIYTVKVPKPFKDWIIANFYK